MCGIAGIFNTDGSPASSVTIKDMMDIIVHRGPDGYGHFVDGAVALGHRRLSIIDIGPGGKQPMTTPDGRYVITYNGELYNYRDIRLELEALGWQFRSHSDTEVLLYALAHWGRDALPKFNGMFAFGLWDKSEKTLLIARDRYGVKPVYYYHQNDVFLFGSEIKSFFPHPAYKKQIDTEGLLEYMTFQNFFTDKTLFKDTQLLPAGTSMLVKADGSTDINQYWDFDFSEPENPRSTEDYLEEFDHLFKQAVNRQLVSDVPVSCYLSGGMDSGSITSIAASQVNPLRTFTVGFDIHSASGLELVADERKSAEFMSYKFKTEHYEMVLKAGDMERCMKNLVWHLEEPRVGQSYPNYYAAQLASKFAKVVLAGSGGDEIFGGYPWRYYRAVVNDNFDDYAEKYYSYWQRLIPNTHIQKAFAPIWNDVKHVWTQDIFKNALGKHQGKDFHSPEDYVNASLYLEAKTFLHGLLVVEDKLSMAHSLENRVPFLDNDLVDFAMRLPVSEKLGQLGEVARLDENELLTKKHKYFDKTRDGKLLVRKAMTKYIPEEVTSAVKQGFSAPDQTWFRGESIDYVKDSLMSNNARIYDYMDKDHIQSLIGEHLNGEKNRRLMVWSLLYLEEWMDAFQ